MMRKSDKVSFSRLIQVASSRHAPYVLTCRLIQVASSRHAPYVLTCTYIRSSGILLDPDDPERLIRRERRSAFRFFGRITYYVLCFISPSGAACV